MKLASPVRKANNTGNGEIEMEFTGLTLGGLQLPLQVDDLQIHIKVVSKNQSKIYIQP